MSGRAIPGGYETWSKEDELRGLLAETEAKLAATEQALRLATGSTEGKPTTVLMTLDKWTAHLADVERFGADQWRSGNAGREPQEFLEWRRQQP